MENDRQLNCEDRAAAEFAVDGDRPAHHRAQMLDDGQTESGAAVHVRRRLVGLREGVEYPLPLLPGHADAVVFYLKGHRRFAIRGLRRHPSWFSRRP